MPRPGTQWSASMGKEAFHDISTPRGLAILRKGFRLEILLGIFAYLARRSVCNVSDSMGSPGCVGTQSRGWLSN